jgi:hypothetical protein
LKAVVPGVEASGPYARLLIIEKLLPAWNAYSTRRKTKWLRREDIVIMISVGGKEGSLEEFGELLKRADERFEVCIFPFFFCATSLFALSCLVWRQ